jgi:valyl-tRNA synthetase
MAANQPPYSDEFAATARQEVVVQETKVAQLEAAKTELQSAEESVRRNCLSVVDHVLSSVLRLLHPFMPFLTEEIWKQMREAVRSSNPREILLARGVSSEGSGAGPCESDVRREPSSEIV